MIGDRTKPLILDSAVSELYRICSRLGEDSQGAVKVYLIFVYDPTTSPGQRFAITRVAKAKRIVAGYIYVLPADVRDTPSETLPQVAALLSLCLRSLQPNIPAAWVPSVSALSTRVESIFESKIPEYQQSLEASSVLSASLTVLPAERVESFVVQLPETALNDFDEIEKLEDQLSRALETCASIDGHDIGGGRVNIFVDVKRATVALSKIKKVLISQNLTESAIIGFRNLDGEMTSVWPKRGVTFDL